MSSVKLNHALGGSTTLEAGNTSSAETVTLPAGNKTLLATDGDGSQLTGINTATVATTAPSSPSVGDMWFDSTSGTTAMKVWNGTAWDQLSNKFAATGGTESTYSSGGTNYKVHTFTSSGTFTVGASGDVDILVVAGGGGGGGRHGGGGGGGGVVHVQNITLPTDSYPVTIGAGGNGTGSNYPGGNGQDTTAFGETAKGGGGGSAYGQPGGLCGNQNGGSGGGEDSRFCTSPGTSTQGTPNLPYGGSGVAYGNSGGHGAAHQNGGGGGAGAAGSQPHGGVGIQINIDGNNHYYAGGGGGGMYSDYQNAGNGGLGGGGGGSAYGNGKTGGSGGGSARNSGGSGGTGTNNSSMVAGNGGANTGGGGGGVGQNNWSNLSGIMSGAGGSGIVIVRYVV